jgi:hypothetical protein
VATAESWLQYNVFDVSRFITVTNHVALDVAMLVVFPVISVTVEEETVTGWQVAGGIVCAATDPAAKKATATINPESMRIAVLLIELTGSSSQSE